MAIKYPPYTKEMHANMLRVLLEKLEKFEHSVWFKPKPSGEISVGTEGSKLVHVFNNLDLAKELFQKVLLEVGQKPEFEKLRELVEELARTPAKAPTPGFPLSFEVFTSSSIRFYSELGQFRFDENGLSTRLMTAALDDIKTKIVELET